MPIPELWHNAALLIYADLVSINVESRESALVALLLFSIVAWSNYLFEFFLVFFCESYLHACEGVLILKEDDGAVTSITLDLFFRIGLLGHRFVNFPYIRLVEEGNQGMLIVF